MNFNILILGGTGSFEQRDQTSDTEAGAHAVSDRADGYRHRKCGMKERRRG